MTEEEWDALKPGDVIQNNSGCPELRVICSTKVMIHYGYIIEDGTPITQYLMWNKIGYIVGKPGTKFAGMNIEELSRNSDFERRLDTEL
jgi:hypothetical protein